MTTSPQHTLARPLLTAGAVLAACLFVPFFFSAGGGLLWYRFNAISALPPLLGLALFSGGMAALRAPEPYGVFARLLRGAVLGLAVFLIAIAIVALLLTLDSDLGGSWGLFGAILNLMIVLLHVIPLVAIAAVLLFVSRKDLKP